MHKIHALRSNKRNNKVKISNIDKWYIVGS